MIYKMIIRSLCFGFDTIDLSYKSYYYLALIYPFTMNTSSSLCYELCLKDYDPMGSHLPFIFFHRV